MNREPRIVQLLDLPSGIEKLRAEASEEGFRFLDRLVSEWQSGRNRFAEPGEMFLGTFRADDLIAVGGLNHDPYKAGPGTGRLRHLYVSSANRGCGVGHAIVRHLLDHAKSVFRLVRLRTQTREAAAFYVTLGFIPVQDETATHLLSLTQS